MDDVPPYQKAFNKVEVSKLKESAFSENSKIYCYSCRTGIGNNAEDFTKSKIDPDTDNSIAQNIANVTGATVHAYQSRTSYEDTLVKPEYRKKIEAMHSMADAISDDALLYEIWNTPTYIVDEAILYPEGALNPVKADTTPKGLKYIMCTYKRKTNEK